MKCRIGIDDMDPEAGLDEFVDAVADAGVGVIYLHARKAWLNGLSPKENRDIPPLDYDRAARLAGRRPDLDVVLNGGLDNAATALAELPRFAGLMLGRAAYRTPMILAELAQSLTGAACHRARMLPGSWRTMPTAALPMVCRCMPSRGICSAFIMASAVRGCGGAGLAKRRATGGMAAR